MSDPSQTNNQSENHNMDNVEKSGQANNINRRSVLRTTGVVATVAITGAGITLAQDSGTTIELGGATQGWEGRAPSSIQGTTNPTLEFTAGEEVTVTWENVDGLPHNFQTLDSSGNVVHETETISTQGATQTTSFTATTEMVEYNCVVHPQSMRGDVSVSSNSSQQQNGTQNQTGTNEDAETGETDENQTQSGNESGGGNENEIEPLPEDWNVTEPSNTTQTNIHPSNKTADENTTAGGNGKAKTGNGKAKSGTGDRS